MNNLEIQQILTAKGFFQRWNPLYFDAFIGLALELSICRLGLSPTPSIRQLELLRIETEKVLIGGYGDAPADSVRVAVECIYGLRKHASSRDCTYVELGNCLVLKGPQPASEAAAFMLGLAKLNTDMFCSNGNLKALVEQKIGEPVGMLFGTREAMAKLEAELEAECIESGADQ